MEKRWFYPNKKVVETSKKQYLLTLVRLQFASDNATFNVGEKIKRGGRTYEFSFRLRPNSR